MTAKNEKQPSYETQVKKVEELVVKLREGKGSLETALKQYEEGVKMITSCLSTIESMEKRVEIVTQNESGEVETKPFE